jgi:hypothetical protein
MKRLGSRISHHMGHLLQTNVGGPDASSHVMQGKSVADGRNGFRRVPDFFYPFIAAWSCKKLPSVAPYKVCPIKAVTGVP